MIINEDQCLKIGDIIVFYPSDIYADEYEAQAVYYDDHQKWYVDYTNDIDIPFNTIGYVLDIRCFSNDEESLIDSDKDVLLLLEDGTLCTTLDGCYGYSVISSGENK